MIDRKEIRAQMGRERVTLTELSRRTGLHANGLRSFLSGGDTKITSLCAIVGALGGDVRLFFDPTEQCATHPTPTPAEPALAAVAKQANGGPDVVA